LPTVAGTTNTLTFAYRGPGISSWWRGENNANDSVYGNNGVLENGAGFAAGEVGTAFNLDGANDFILVQTPTNSNVNAGKSGELTIEEWIKPTSIATAMLLAEYENKLATFNGNDV